MELRPDVFRSIGPGIRGIDGPMFVACIPEVDVPVPDGPTFVACVPEVDVPAPGATADAAICPNGPFDSPW